MNPPDLKPAPPLYTWEATVKGRTFDELRDRAAIAFEHFTGHPLRERLIIDFDTTVATFEQDGTPMVYQAVVKVGWS